MLGRKAYLGFIQEYSLVDHIFSFITNILLFKDLKKVKIGKIIIINHPNPDGILLIENVKYNGLFKCTEVSCRSLDNAQILKKFSLGYVDFKIFDYIRPKFEYNEEVLFQGMLSKDTFLIESRFLIYSALEGMHYRYNIINKKYPRFFYGHIAERYIFKFKAINYNDYWAKLNE